MTVEQDQAGPKQPEQGQPGRGLPEQGQPEQEPPEQKRRNFVVIPAVDLLGEEAVRLERGDYSKTTIRAGRPAALVERFAAAGSALIHVVDLDGARSGRIRPRLVEELVGAAAGVPVQASGGIRTVADATALLETGARLVIVGTAAFASPEALTTFVGALGDRLVVALDVRAGRLSVAGWRQDSQTDVAEAARRCAEAGVQRLHCTAIERDGTLAGPDLDLMRTVTTHSGLPTIAAGGISSMRDLDRLAELDLEGAVVGRALLEGRIPESVLAWR